MSFRAGGVFGDQADYQSDEELKLVHWVCDAAGCQQKTEPRVNQDIAQRYAAQEGWAISDRGAWCPKHRDDREIGPGFEIEERGTEPPAPAPPPPPPVIQRVEVTPPALQILVFILALAVVALATLLLREYNARALAEYSLRGFNQDAFELRSGIRELSCTSLFDTPRRCSGRMQTEGKPDVPVRYVCDAQDCRFEK